MRSRLLGYLSTAAAFGALLSLAAWAVSSSDPDSWVRLAGILIGVSIGLAAAYTRVIRTGRGRRALSAVDLEREAAALAEAVHRQWRAEASARFALSGPLPVRWTAEVTPGHEPVDMAWSGASHTSLAEFVQGLPSRRLVIVGEPGAGKSTLAMLLTLDLLQQRASADPVPVLVNVSSWNPFAESLRDWLSTRLAADYPQLSRRGHPGRQVASELLASNRLIVVLDGFDEISGSWRAAAYAAITVEMRLHQPFVLTSRFSEFREAVLRAGSPLPQAAVVELRDIDIGDVIDVLDRGSWGRLQWAPVVHHLRTYPDSPLAYALVKPLTISLALQAYADPARDPTELLTLDTGDQVMRHLIDAYLVAAYSASPTAPRLGGEPVYPFHRAGSWLSFLAVHLTRRRTNSLVWYDLAGATPLALIRWISALALAAGFAVTAAVVAGWMTAVALGAAVVVAMPLMATTTRPDGVPHSGFLVRRLGGMAALTAAAAALMVEAWNAPPPLVAAAVTITLFYAFSVEVLDRRASPALVATSADSFRGAVARAAAAATGRAALMGLALAISTAVVGLVASASVGSAVALPTLAAFAVTLLGSPWGGFLLARVWLASRADQPWRLQRFLDDAHLRGVLRQTGAAYQFRFALLQDRLAGIAPDCGRESAEGVNALFHALSVQHHNLLESLPVKSVGGSHD